eukprot:2343140-Pyramimonas_sp.AAC.1
MGVALQLYIEQAGSNCVIETERPWQSHSPMDSGSALLFALRTLEVLAEPSDETRLYAPRS